MSKIVKTLAILFAILNIKSIPFAYLVRFYWCVFTNLIVPRFKYLANGKLNTFGITGLTPKVNDEHKLDLFHYTTMNTYVSPLEIDMYLHKSNSTYMVDLDLARTDLVTKVFQSLFYQYFDNELGEFKKAGKISNFPYVPVASIQCIFKRELTVFQRYQIKSKVLAWDNKWLFVLSKFVIPNSKPKDGEKLCALGITKYVFKKNGRITIRPVEMIKQCGLYNDEVERVNQENYKLIGYMSSTDELEDVAAKFGNVIDI